MRHKHLFALLVCLLCFSCTGKYKPIHDATVRHASLLQMQTLNHERTLCRIMNPWIPQQPAMQYLLVDAADSLYSDTDGEALARQYGEFQLLRTPLCRQALTASCHAWLLGQLDALDGVAVMCDAGYVLDSTMQQRMAAGLVQDGGSSMAPNAEVLLSSGCDALWISPFENSAIRSHRDRFHIPEIYCADYMETSPLARAEWMRFYGRLVGRAAMADSLFAVVEARYDSIALQSDSLYLADSTALRPLLLSDTPYAGTWYVPGGCSTLGQLYQDAGFRYPWSSDRHAGSLALSPEAVFHEAHDADVWIFKYHSEGTMLSHQQFVGQHHFFPQIKAVREGHLYGCNTAISNYFDITPFRPDLLIEELVCLAQNRTDSLRFFQLLPAN